MSNNNNNTNTRLPSFAKVLEVTGQDAPLKDAQRPQRRRSSSTTTPALKQTRIDRGERPPSTTGGTTLRVEGGMMQPPASAQGGRTSTFAFPPGGPLTSVPLSGPGAPPRSQDLAPPPTPLLAHAVPRAPTSSHHRNTQHHSEHPPQHRAIRPAPSTRSANTTFRVPQGFHRAPSFTSSESASCPPPTYHSGPASDAVSVRSSGSLAGTKRQKVEEDLLYLTEQVVGVDEPLEPEEEDVEVLENDLSRLYISARGFFVEARHIVTKYFDEMDAIERKHAQLRVAKARRNGSLPTHPRTGSPSRIPVLRSASSSKERGRSFGLYSAVGGYDHAALFDTPEGSQARRRS